MGATSVTGVGAGSAEGSTKGPNNGRNIYAPLLSPHVVAAGRVTLSGGVKTVTFPTALPGSQINYVVVLTAINSGVDANAAVVTAMTDSGGDFVSFAIAGTDTEVVMYTVMTAGHA